MQILSEDVFWQNPLINPVLGIRIQKEKGTEVISRVRPLNKKIKTHEKVDESHTHWWWGWSENKFINLYTSEIRVNSGDRPE